MASTNQVFQAAETLGDVSSIRTMGTASDRFMNRVIGKAAGRTMGAINLTMGVFGLIAWAQFLDWMTEQVRLEAAEKRYMGTFAAYAAGYEFGFTNPPGSHIQNQPRPFFFPGIRAAANELFGGPAGIQQTPEIGRSGLYIGGKFASDMRSVVRGDPIGRIGRRAAGEASSRFFWGALANPDKNFIESFVKLAVRKARKIAKRKDLEDTGALIASITWGESPEEVKHRSYSKIMSKAAGDPRLDRRLGTL